MPRRLPTLPPKDAFYPPNDVSTHRDLLRFEERLKLNYASLNRRKRRYQGVSLPRNIERFVLMAISKPCQYCTSSSIPCSVDYISNLLCFRSIPTNPVSPGPLPMAAPNATCARSVLDRSRTYGPPLHGSWFPLRMCDDLGPFLLEWDVFGED